MVLVTRAGRPDRAFDPQVHADRDVVERCSDRLEQFRALVTRDPDDA